MAWGGPQVVSKVYKVDSLGSRVYGTGMTSKHWDACEAELAGIVEKYRLARASALAEYRRERKEALARYKKSRPRQWRDSAPMPEGYVLNLVRPPTPTAPDA